jgi:hypothetical protein
MPDFYLCTVSICTIATYARAYTVSTTYTVYLPKSLRTQKGPSARFALEWRFLARWYGWSRGNKTKDSRQTNILLSVGDSFEVKSLYVHGQATCSPITILYNFREDIHTSSVAMAIARNSIPRAVDMDTKRQIFLQATPSLSIPFSTVVSPGLSKPTTDVSSHHSTTNRSDAYLEFPCIVLRRTTSRMNISAISSV